MQFDSFSDFIAMGGYGFYVWLSFGTCALILLGILFSSLRRTLWYWWINWFSVVRLTRKH